MIRETTKFAKFISKKKWLVLLLWQLCSILLCAMNVINSILSKKNGKTLPFFQMALTYFLLFLIFIWNFRKNEISWLKYLIVVIFNILGDTSSIMAYNTTSLSSAMLLGTTVIFWVAPLSYIFMKRFFSTLQILSLFVGFGGVVMIFIGDGVGKSRWKGNLLALCSALFYAIANILQESLVYSAPVTIYLSRLSIISTPITCILSGSIEWKSIKNYNWNLKTCILICLYSIILCLYYISIPSIMQFSNATEMNISLLSSNFFSLLISILCFNQKPIILYLIGFFCVPISIALFTLFPYKEKKINNDSLAQNLNNNNFTNSNEETNS